MLRNESSMLLSLLGTKIPENESSNEGKFQGTKVLFVDSWEPKFSGTKVP